MRFAAICLGAAALLRLAGATAQDAPYETDQHTVLLLHLDADGTDATGRSRAKTRGKVEYADGKFGKAMRGGKVKGGLVLGPSRALDLRERSWTVECWFKPEGAQDRYASLFGFSWGNGRILTLDISHNRELRLSLGAGPFHRAVTISRAMGETLRDGRWHHVAAVVDRARHGELRIYVDGQEVTARGAAQPWPVESDAGKGTGTIGAVLPWYLGTPSAFRGLIDEVRVSARIREGYAAVPGTPMPRPAEPLQPRPESAMALDAPPSAKPLSLSPEDTVIVLRTFYHYAERDVAQVLQKGLRHAYGVDKGFAIVNEHRPKDLEGKAVLAVGRTLFAAPEDVAGLETCGFRVRRRGRAVLLTGGSAKGALYAAVHFLDRFCDVRFYLPGTLWMSRPKKTPIVLGKVHMQGAPYTRVAGARTGGGDFPKLHGLDRRPTSHQHTMCARFPPAWFAEKYPEIYPIIKGKRYIPTRGDQRWQPCFSEPKLVDAAVESAERFFRDHPGIEYVAFSIQDSHTFCERDLASEQVRKHGKVQGLSNLYWAFLNRVAERLEARHPDNQVVGLVYSDVRMPPPFKLHRNVIAWMVFKMSDIVIDKRFADLGAKDSYVRAWAEAASAIGHHDWFHGHGFLIPRIYTGYIQRTFLQFERLGAPIRFAYAECYPNWGLDGPKCYLLARLWWDPRTDVEAELTRFCDDLFGKAAGPMHRYFALLEDLYCNHMNRRIEQKLFRWERQFACPEGERVLFRHCRQLLDQALRAADDERARRRIELFSKTFRYAELLVEIGSAKTVSKAKLDHVRRYAAEVIAPDPMTVFRRGGADDVTKQLEQVLARITRGKPQE